MSDITLDIQRDDFTLDIVREDINIELGKSTIFFTGDSSTTARSYTLGAITSAYRIVANNQTDGRVIACDSSDQDFANMALGLTTQAGTENQSVQVVMSGYVKNTGWSFNLTDPIYFDSTGALTQTPPVSGFVQIVAQPITSIEIDLNIQQSIKL